MIRVRIEAPGYSRYIYTPYQDLRFRALRAFLVVLPTVSYAEPIAVDVSGRMFFALPHSAWNAGAACFRARCPLG